MKTRLTSTATALLATASFPAWAQPGGSPSGGAEWYIYAGGGFLAGLALGLFLCWLRCRGKDRLKVDDITSTKR
jgi:hypothetical protein